MFLWITAVLSIWRDLHWSETLEDSCGCRRRCGKGSLVSAGWEPDVPSILNYTGLGNSLAQMFPKTLPFSALVSPYLNKNILLKEVISQFPRVFSFGVYGLYSCQALVDFNITVIYVVMIYIYRSVDILILFISKLTPVMIVNSWTMTCLFLDLEDTDLGTEHHRSGQWQVFSEESEG